jgi:sugar phosphate isomerase/epimerase
VDGLRPTAQALAEHGLRLGLEFIGPYHHRRRAPHEFIFTPGQMLELAADIAPNVGLLVDSYHAYTSGTPWKQLAALPSEKIVLVHFNDAANLPLHELKDGERLLPGDGVTDGVGFLKAIQATGYKGPVSVEVFGALRGVEPNEAAKRAGAATMKVWRQAGLA